MNPAEKKRQLIDSLPTSYPAELRGFLKENFKSQIEGPSNPYSLSPSNLEQIRVSYPGSFLALNIDFQDSFFVREAYGVYPYSVNHRSSYLSQGWKSLCLHGLSAEKTQSYQTYGYNTQDEAPYQWTEMSQLAPQTTQFLKEKIPMKKWYRVRWMFLEPGGYILPHKDYDPSRDRHSPRMNAINIAITHPEGCLFVVENEGEIPFKPGKAFYFKGAQSHALINHSKELRIHMIIHGVPDEPAFIHLLETK